jgi:small subunit ribosomal protein S21|tara:strand:- start:7263 stop:7457 length:195 start_codon:yes stop_codon:yes gene_type:complete
MLIIKVRKGNIEQALKQMRRKFVKTQTMKNLRTNRYYKKPSEKRREEIQKATDLLKWKRENDED